jgi:hypothetical protein
MRTETLNLLKALKKGITKETGIESVNAKGIAYRYDTYVNSYKTTPYFLVNLFTKAVKASGVESYKTMFTDGNITFYFDRATLKGQKHGNISYKELVILN